MAYPEESPGLNGGVLRGDGVEVGGDLGGDAGGRVGAEELAELLLLLGGVGRELLDRERLAAEPVRDEDAVLLRAVLRAAAQDVGALQGLREVPEDVVDDDDALGRVAGAGSVFF